MARRITKETQLVERVMKEHFPNYPADFPPAAYLYNSASIRLRIVDKGFQSVPVYERLDLVNPVIHMLPKQTQQKIIFVSLVSPNELEMSSSNYEFEHPSPQPRIAKDSRNGRPTNKSTNRPRIPRGART